MKKVFALLAVVSVVGLTSCKNTVEETEIENTVFVEEVTTIDEDEDFEEFVVTPSK